MSCSATSPPMLCNFKKRFLRSLVRSSPQHEQQPLLFPSEPPADDSSERINDLVAQPNQAIATAGTGYGSGCTSAFCAMHPEIDDVVDPTCTVPHPHLQNHARRSFPSFRSVMEVLYPSSHLGAPSPFPDPPSYTGGDSLTYSAQRDDPEISPLISSMTTGINGTPLSCSCPDPLAEDPSLTGVPSQGIPSRGVLLVEPTPPVVDLDTAVSEEPLPAYSRFDQRRPRFPAASDILGPYPPASVLC